MGSLPLLCLLCFHTCHLLFSPFSLLLPAIGILGDPCWHLLPVGETGGLRAVALPCRRVPGPSPKLGSADDRGASAEVPEGMRTGRQVDPGSQAPPTWDRRSRAPPTTHRLPGAGHTIRHLDGVTEAQEGLFTSYFICEKYYVSIGELQCQFISGAQRSDSTRGTWDAGLVQEAPQVSPLASSTCANHQVWSLLSPPFLP